MMEIKNKGIVFEVRDNKSAHLGDCHLTKTGITWCDGRTTARKGKQLSWDSFIQMMKKL